MQRFHGRIDIGDIGGELAGLLRSAHAHEVHCGVGGAGDVGGEFEFSALLSLHEEFTQSRFEEGRTARSQCFDLRSIDVYSRDLMAQ